MYFNCSTCNKELACFWCSMDFLRTNNLSIRDNIKLKCKKC